MESRSSFYLFVAAIFLAGLSLVVVRNHIQGIPLTPSTNQTHWEIESTIEFYAYGDPVNVILARPMSQGRLIRHQESGASSGYGLSYITPSQAQWSIRQASGIQRIYYRTLFKETLSSSSPSRQDQVVPGIENAVWPESHRIAAEQIVQEAWDKSADGFSLALEILKAFRGEDINQNARLLLTTPGQDVSAITVKLLNFAGVASREIKILELEDGRRRQPLQSYIKVWDQGKEKIFHPKSGTIGLPPQSLIWSDQGQPVLEVVGGRNSHVYFSIIKRELPFDDHSRPAQEGQNGNLNTNLLDFSIQSLPIGEQALFKTILLIPIGALVVVFMRVLVGLQTSGTFMPVLFAIAFLETSLTTGLIGFILVVSTGLIFRSYLSNLNLLLVARISAVIVAVIGIIGVFSILSYQIGLTEGLKITFFPLIILAWTVERMSILWEEEGPREVIRQGAGSLAVAVIAYLFMNNETIRHLAFNFIGVQLILLSIILLMGSYTGYRLTEIYRFKPFLNSKTKQK